MDRPIGRILPKLKMILCQILILSKYDILVSLRGSHPENTTPNWQSWGPAEVVLCPGELIQLNQTHPLHLPYMPSFLDPVHHGDAGASIFISSAIVYFQHPFDVYMDFWIYEVSICDNMLYFRCLWTSISLPVDFHFPHPGASKVLSRLCGKKSAGNRKGSQRLEKVPLVSVLLFCDPPKT